MVICQHCVEGGRKRNHRSDWPAWPSLRVAQSLPKQPALLQVNSLVTLKICTGTTRTKVNLGDEF